MIVDINVLSEDGAVVIVPLEVLTPVEPVELEFYAEEEKSDEEKID